MIFTFTFVTEIVTSEWQFDCTEARDYDTENGAQRDNKLYVAERTSRTLSILLTIEVPVPGDL